MLERIRKRIRQHFLARLFCREVLQLVQNIISYILSIRYIYKSGDILYIGIIDTAGFGDNLMELPLLQGIKKATGLNCYIIYVTRFPRFFQRFAIVDEAVSGKNRFISTCLVMAKCDLILEAGHVSHIMSVRKLQRNKVQKLSPLLLAYCDDNIAMQKNRFYDSPHNFRIDQYGKILGRHRIEFYDMHGILGISKNDVIEMPSFGDDQLVLKKYVLTPRSYIVVNRDVGSGGKEHNKLWGIEKYVGVIKGIQELYPHMKVVLLGVENSKEIRQCVDYDLTKQTSLEETAVLLKNSRFLLSSEGGLVHLQHFLLGKSIVLFGPTDLSYLGYDENDNLCSNVCGGCYWLIENWHDTCIRKSPICMETLEIDDVLRCVKKYCVENGEVNG